MDKKAINIIIVVAVLLATGAVIIYKNAQTPSNPCCGGLTMSESTDRADTAAAKKLPKIIKISSLGKKTTPCSPCGALTRLLDEIQAQYQGKFTVETYYSTDKDGQALIEQYKIDAFSFIDHPVQMIFLNSKGERSETQLGLYAAKEQIIAALKEVGVE